MNWPARVCGGRGSYGIWFGLWYLRMVISLGLAQANGFRFGGAVGDGDEFRVADDRVKRSFRSSRCGPGTPLLSAPKHAPPWRSGSSMRCPGRHSDERRKRGRCKVLASLRRSSLPRISGRAIAVAAVQRELAGLRRAHPRAVAGRWRPFQRGYGSPGTRSGGFERSLAVGRAREAGAGTHPH